MITEKGKLVFGIEYEGETHKEFEIRPQLVKDSVEISESDNPRVLESDYYAGICILAKQIIKLGTIPHDKITADLILEMAEDDCQIISAAKEALESRFRSFRDEKPADKAKADKTP